MILNLSEPSSYGIKFKVSNFPDGQQAVTILEEGIQKHESFRNLKDPVIIKSRLTSFRDLELVICANKALRELGVKDIKLEICYLLGARSDRKFETGSVNYIKEVLAPIINMQNFSSVTVLDAHSDVTEACLANYRKETQYSQGFITFVLRDYFVDGSTDYSKMRLISPDAGALKKVYDVAESIGYKEEIIIASKHRDVKTGKITHTDVPISVHDAGKDFFILDDICDGGRTFIEIAKAIKTKQSLSSAVHPDQHGKIYLVVTHGIFSAGLKPLNEYFDGIYTTNSYVDMSDPNFSLTNDNEMHKLKQLKVI
jgi:ribose-phosphate pyrophosphokinase